MREGFEEGIKDKELGGVQPKKESDSSPWLHHGSLFMFIFFACPKKTNQKKGHFFEGIFGLASKTVLDFLKSLQGFAIS